MILPIQQRISDAVRLAVQRQFGLAEVPAFAIETPPSRALGDLAVTVAFQLARTLRKAPRAIAQELAPALGTIEGVERIVATPNGYLNLFLERPSFVLSNTLPSIPIRPRTSVTCATLRWATRWCACCDFAARRWKCRTTSTTWACRLPT
jgi:hypothetical protein